MAPQQRLLHAALGIARDVASKSNVAAGGCSHLRERIASRSLGFAAERHTACASFRSKDGRAGAWVAQPATADVLAGWKARMAASSFASSARRGAECSTSSRSGSSDGDESVASSESSASDGATAGCLPSLPRRRAPWQSATATAASSFSAFRPDPDGHAAAAGSSEQQRRHARHVFVAHRRMSTAATAASGAAPSSRQHGSDPPSADGAADGREPGARAAGPDSAAASLSTSDARDGAGSGLHAEQLPPTQRGGQLGPASRDFVYEGPLAAPKLSLFSCACSLAAAPIIVGLGDAASAAGPRASIAVMVATVGIFTTGLLHWFTSPYVHRLAYDAASGVVETRTLNVLARPRVDRFPASAVRYPQTLQPQATFQVNGKVFYVDADHFGDTDLLALLSPPDPDQPPQRQPSVAKMGGAQQ